MAIKLYRPQSSSQLCFVSTGMKFRIWLRMCELRLPGGSRGNEIAWLKRSKSPTPPSSSCRAGPFRPPTRPGRLGALLAFCAWTFALPNTPFRDFEHWYSPALASIAVLLASSVLGLLAPLFQRPLATGLGHSRPARRDVRGGPCARPGSGGAPLRVVPALCRTVSAYGSGVSRTEATSLPTIGLVTLLWASVVAVFTT